MADRYWVGTGNWDTTNTANWSASNGGPSGASVPGSVDDVFFTSLSGSGTATVTAAVVCRSLNFTGFTGTFAGTFQVSISGSLTLASGWNRTHTGTLLFVAATTGHTISSGGITLANLVQFNNASGGWTVTTNLTTTGNFTLTSGNVTISSGLTVTANAFTTSGTLTRSLTINGANVVLTGTGTIWSYASVTNLTLNASTSVIEINNTSNTAITFNSSSTNLQYGTVFFNRGASTATITINGASTFQLFRDRGTAAHTLSFQGGLTNTFNNFDVRGASAAARITLSRSALATTAFVKSPGGLIACDFITVGAINVTPNNLVSPFIPTWYAGSGSNDTGTPVTGWI